MTLDDFNITGASNTQFSTSGTAVYIEVNSADAAVFRGTYDITLTWATSDLSLTYEQNVRICIWTGTNDCELPPPHAMDPNWIVAPSA